MLKDCAPPAEETALGAAQAALNHLEEGLTAALPSDEQGWLVQERFQRAKRAIKRAIELLEQEDATRQ